MKQPKLGLLLPHFGEHASAAQCLEVSSRAEIYGFHSVWARDHLVFKPHRIEGQNNNHLEGMLLLASVASATEKIRLGTAMTICHRHPIHLAQLGASLSAIAGGRLVLGIGLGGFAHEFAAAGWPTSLADRAELVKANIEVCRRLWNGETVSYLGPCFDFEQVTLKPTPIKEIPIWIGGGTAAACRRAAAVGDGWMPARVTLATFTSRISYLRDLCSAMGRSMITTAVMPLTSLGRTVESALTGIDVKAVVDESQRFTPWIKSPADSFSESDGSRGLLLAGTPADIIRDTRALADAGADHVVYDLRLRFADWREQLELLGKEVLPAFAENSADQS